MVPQKMYCVFNQENSCTSKNYPDYNIGNMTDFILEHVLDKEKIMLVTFRTEAHAGITMFGDVAKLMLKKWGIVQQYREQS